MRLPILKLVFQKNPKERDYQNQPTLPSPKAVINVTEQIISRMRRIVELEKKATIIIIQIPEGERSEKIKLLLERLSKIERRTLQSLVTKTHLDFRIETEDLSTELKSILNEIDALYDEISYLRKTEFPKGQLVASGPEQWKFMRQRDSRLNARYWIYMRKCYDYAYGQIHSGTATDLSKLLSEMHSWSDEIYEGVSNIASLVGDQFVPGKFRTPEHNLNFGGKGLTVIAEYPMCQEPGVFLDENGNTRIKPIKANEIQVQLKDVSLLIDKYKAHLSDMGDDEKLLAIGKMYYFLIISHPFLTINNSLIMIIVNILLEMSGLAPMLHGSIDSAVGNYIGQPSEYAKYFAGMYHILKIVQGESES